MCVCVCVCVVVAILPAAAAQRRVDEEARAEQLRLMAEYQNTDASATDGSASGFLDELFEEEP